MAVITDDGGSAIVDAGQSPSHAREIQGAMRAAGLPAARWLVHSEPMTLAQVREALAG